MGKIITIFNQKGGVGKTTTTVNIAAALGLLDKNVLVVDMDPQGNATSGLGVDKNREKIVYDLLRNDVSIQDVIEKTQAENVYVIPSNGDLAGVEIEMAREGNWQSSLKDKLDTLKEEYDYILIDSPPSLGILSILGLVASDSILIPVQCEYYALEGVGQLIETIGIVKDNFNPNLEIEGVVMSMFDGRTNLSIQVVEEIKDFFGDKVYMSMIPRNVRLAEAPSYGMDIFNYDSKSKGAEAYMDLAKEILNNN